MDIAALDWGLGAGRMGAFAARSCWEGLGCGRELSEVDDIATGGAAAAAFPAAMATFIPRAASFPNAQHSRLDTYLNMELFFFVFG